MKPEDIKTDWARLRPLMEREARGHRGDGCLTIRVVVCDGLPLWAGGSYRSVDGVHDGRAKGWWAVVRRLGSMVKRARARHFMLVMDIWLHDGRPVLWTAPAVYKLEPIKKAQAG